MRQVDVSVAEYVALSGVASECVISRRYIYTGRRYSCKPRPLRGRRSPIASFRTRSHTVCVLNILDTRLSVDVKKRARLVLRYGSSQCCGKRGLTHIAVWIFAMLQGNEKDSTRTVVWFIAKFVKKTLINWGRRKWRRRKRFQSSELALLSLMGCTSSWRW